MTLSKLTTSIKDKIAIILSMICVLQCLFLPLLITALPLLDIWWLEDSFLHPILLLVVIPLTLITLIPGYKKHKNIQPIIIATPALLLLIAGAFIPESVVEKLLTVVGALVLATAHIRNMLLSRKTNK